MAYYRRTTRNFRSVSRRGASRRRTGWIRNINNAASPGPLPNPGAVDLLPVSDTNAGLEAGNVDAGSTLGATIMRVRGVFAFHHPGFIAFSENFIYGFVVCPRSLIPSPQTGIGAFSWMDWGTADPGLIRWNAANYGTDSNALSYDFDIKSKRVITQPGETLKFCWAMTGGMATGVDFWKMTSSVLMKWA